MSALLNSLEKAANQRAEHLRKQHAPVIPKLKLRIPTAHPTGHLEEHSMSQASQQDDVHDSIPELTQKAASLNTSNTDQYPPKAPISSAGIQQLIHNKANRPSHYQNVLPIILLCLCLFLVSLNFINSLFDASLDTHSLKSTDPTPDIAKIAISDASMPAPSMLQPIEQAITDMAVQSTPSLDIPLPTSLPGTTEIEAPHSIFGDDQDHAIQTIIDSNIYTADPFVEDPMMFSTAHTTEAILDSQITHSSPKPSAPDKATNTHMTIERLPEKAYITQSTSDIDSIIQEPQQSQQTVILLISQGYYQSAFQQLAFQLEANPMDTYVYPYLFQLIPFIAFEKMHALMLQLLEKNPHYGQLSFAMGNLYANQKLWNDAHRYFLKSLQDMPYNPDTLFNTAVSAEHLNRPQQALAYYQQALLLAQHTVASFSIQTAEQRISQLNYRLQR